MDATTGDAHVETTNGDINDNLTTENNNSLLETNNETKKVKYETQQTTDSNGLALNRKSRVVHVRNIPVDTSEQDLVQLASGFGRVTNCLVLRGESRSL